MFQNFIEYFSKNTSGTNLIWCEFACKHLGLKILKSDYFFMKKIIWRFFDLSASPVVKQSIGYSFKQKPFIVLFSGVFWPYARQF